MEIIKACYAPCQFYLRVIGKRGFMTGDLRFVVKYGFEFMVNLEDRPDRVLVTCQGREI